MRVALAVHRTLPTVEATVDGMRRWAAEAAAQAADLIVFSEAATTGFVATGDPTRDSRLAEPIPGPTTAVMMNASRRLKIWSALGLYERDGSTLFDSAVLIADDGTIALKHRRSDAHWYPRDADAAVYGTGDGPSIVETPFGSMCILLCGEFVGYEQISAVRRLAPDFLLVPFARGYDEDAPDDEAWYQREVAWYARQARRVGSTTLMVNHLDPAGHGSFGGAIAIAYDGAVIGQMSLHEEGLLLVEV